MQCEEERRKTQERDDNSRRGREIRESSCDGRREAEHSISIFLHLPSAACYINQALLALAPAATPKYIILPIHQNIQSQTPSVEFKAQSSEVSGMEGSTVNRPYPYVYCTPRPPPSRLTHTNPPLVVLNSRDAENVTENACWNGRGR